ncbi:glycosyltransferase family 4 protein [Nakamurella lactea]|uniref:glycosyltransferase family 4 protein n=1 Tax=Nakamurella lactea TaxID=459515 RepID=UPI0004140B06|nr:glycosyltransferase family 1 protein [Nakamurella lactea]
MLISALNGRMPGAKNTASLVARLQDLLTPMDPEKTWLTLAVLEGKLPDTARVIAIHRAAELDGVLAALRAGLWNGPLPRLLDAGPWRQVSVVTDRVVVDVHHTSRTDFATGIQRVTREATRRWAADHRPLMIGWTDDLTAMRALSAAEAHRAFWGGPPVTIPENDPLVVPWGCRYLLPELAAEVERTGRVQALAKYSRSTFGAIGYDLVPVTTAETAHHGLIPGFTRNLVALRGAAVVVPISHAAAGEYRGWRKMLDSIDVQGPRIEPVVLASEPPAPSRTRRKIAGERLLLGELPMVLVVGSHEPRKNHVAVLHAAEVLWREGLRFSLTFIGGNAWNSDIFTADLQKLQLAGRPVETISAAKDDLLWGAYELARFTVFPSVNEGFGLPIVESLSVGTPVITSNFGSMKEIADAGGGALLVNPRDDASIVEAMRTLLVDDALLDELGRQALAREQRTWDQYARETWEALMGTMPTPTVLSPDRSTRTGLAESEVMSR